MKSHRKKEKIDYIRLSKERQNIIKIALNKNLIHTDSCGNVYIHKVGGNWLKKPRITYSNNGRYYRTHFTIDRKQYKFLSHNIVYIDNFGFYEEHLEINHKDGDKLNNHPNNLEAITVSENHSHAYRIGLINNSGENHSQSILTWKDVDYIRRVYICRDKKFGQKPLAKKFGVSKGSIEAVVHNTGWIKGREK